MKILMLRLLHLLPRRVQTSLYHRFLIHWKHRFLGRFEAAHLNLAPSVVMKLSPTDGFHGEIALLGLYEEITSRLIHAIAVEEGGLLVDVGANYGYYSLLWCAANAKNHVMAVEASPANITPLRYNLALNHLEERSMVLEWAASRANGKVVFNCGSREETGWGGIASSDSLSDLHVSVPAHRLDEGIPAKEITVLKIDCEGADAWVIEGASGLLAEQRIAHVFFEENPFRQAELGTSPGTALRTLEKFGYKWELLDPNAAVKNYRAWR